MPDRVNRHHRTGFTKTIFIKTVLLVRVNVVSITSTLSLMFRIFKR